MSIPFDGQPRRDRHTRKILALGISDPRCSSCWLDKLPALRLMPDGSILCANCKRGDEPLSLKVERAKRERFAQGGSTTITCGLCGDDNLRHMQFHHIAGDANGELGVPLCENCHAVVTDAQQDLPKDPGLLQRDDERSPMLRIAAYLEGGAILLGILVIGLLVVAVYIRSADVALSASFGNDYHTVITAELRL